MITETQNQQPAVNVYPNAGANNGGLFGDGLGSGNIFVWFILFFFMIMFMGWGNNYGNNGGNGGNYAPQFVPYPAYALGMQGGSGCSAAEAVRSGFDQAAVMNELNGLGVAMNQGFAGAEIARCNQQANLMNAFNSQAMALQNCCCENRAGLADVKYAMAQEACADRAAVKDALYDLTAQNNANMNAMANMFNNGMNALRSDFFQYQMSCKDDKIADLQRQLTFCQTSDLVNGSRATILANNDQQTATLEQYLAPVARPAYIVQNPSCCNQNYTPCGCYNRG